MNNNNNNLIVRYNTTITRPYNVSKIRNTTKLNQKLTAKFDLNASTVLQSTMNNSHGKYRKVYTKHVNNLPQQIAIKRKNCDGGGMNKFNNTEVLYLNGNWETSSNNSKLPNIIAEMHNVNIEELQQSLQSTCGNNKQMKLETGDYVPSPLSSDSGIEGDSDGNLSWLLNYKIHELPPVPEDITDCGSYDQNTFNYCQNPSISSNGTYHQEKQYYDPQYSQNQMNVTHIIADKPDKVKLNVKEDGNKSNGHSYRYTGPKKPPFTYTELIEHALNEKGELTVSGIYQWISDHFPFYKQNDDRWKNSVRHNLSINPHFRKGGKAIHGAGHLWTIAQKDDKKSWNIKKQRMQQFMQTAYNDWNKERQLELELATATASILPENSDNYQKNCDNSSEIYIQAPNVDIKQENVEIEYVIDVTEGLEDFLCPPVPKQQVVEECGLAGDYLITDLNPTTLGLNLGEAEIITGGNLYDDLNFQCYELQTE